MINSLFEKNADKHTLLKPSLILTNTKHLLIIIESYQYLDIIP